MKPDEPDEPDDRASDQRLQSLLGLLQSEREEGDPQGVRSVMRGVRWQRSVRELLHAIGGLAAGVVEGVALAVGVRLGGREDRQ
ncbi:MAG: hypothetical protein H0V40_07775 [Actinobacteria bacterium]|nr:hypothetical protein [Actinomycetota bacterium]